MKNFFIILLIFIATPSAKAESLDVFFDEQTAEKTPTTPAVEVKKEPKANTETIKPQVLYLEDLEPKSKPEPKTKTTNKDIAPEISKPLIATPIPPLAPIAPKSAENTNTKIKKEPLPENIATNNETPKSNTFNEIKPKRKIDAKTNTNDNEQETLSQYHEKNSGQYAPFMDNKSRSQAAFSLKKQADNEDRAYPSGLNSFLNEFNQKFNTLKPNQSILDTYKSAPINETTIIEPLTQNIEAKPLQRQEAKIIEPTQPITSEEKQPEIIAAATNEIKYTEITGKTNITTIILPEDQASINNGNKAVLDQIAADYRSGVIPVINLTGYVNTKNVDNTIRTYSELQNIGRKQTKIVVDYLNTQNVPTEKIAYRIIPTSNIVIQNPFYESSNTATFRLDIEAQKS